MQVFNNKYERLKDELSRNKTGKMKCFGFSMLPILQSGSMLTFVVEEEYEVDDIVFCKVKGRYIDAHKVVQKDKQKGYLIANNKGHENGWTKTVYGRAADAFSGGKEKKFEQKKSKASKKWADDYDAMLVKQATSIYHDLHRVDVQSLIPVDITTYEAKLTYWLHQQFPNMFQSNPVMIAKLREIILTLRDKDYMRK